MKVRLTIETLMKAFLFTLVLSGFAFSQMTQREFARSQVIRIKPSDFSLSPHCPKMPRQVISYLETKNCTIPQSYRVKNNHNAFEGEFFRKGQFDWAVLCSRNEISSILLFPNGSTDEVQEIAQMPDIDFVQPIDGKGTLGFIRLISKPNAQLLSQRYNNPSEPIVFEHNGLDTVTVQKKILVYYFINDMFIVLDNLFNDIKFR